MAFTTYPVKVWACIPQPERVACYSMSDASALLLGYVLKATIEGAFLIASPTWYETRLGAYVECYGLEADTVEIDGIEVDVYLTNRSWMTALAACRLAGDCDLEKPRCLQFAFFDSP